VKLGSGDAPQLAQFEFNYLTEKIKRVLFAEPLGRIDLPVKTALEMALRQQEWAQRIGPAFGRFVNEFIIPFVSRGLFILDEFGIIDIEPFIDGDILDIEFKMPIALAKEMESVRNMSQYLEILGNFYGPEILQTMAKPDVTARILGEKLNIPKEMIPTPQEIETIKQALQARAEQQAEAEATAVQQGQAEAA
jgi:hypothetical protein